ncbi:MAG: DUF3160 domain-containing protein [Planctomycetes bacterium]|nr:DUF3160 domain-containing protein [Planctomycetota bacterium]
MNASAFRLITASCVLACQAMTQEGEGDWRRRAEATLGEPGVRQLERDRFLITSRGALGGHAEDFGRTGLRQCFDAYVWNDGFPVFVTTDVLLNAFHVLLEDSVLEFERRNAVAMPSRLRATWDALPHVIEERLRLTDRDLIDAAEQRLRMVLAVALALLDVQVFDASDERQVLVDEEVRRVVAARGQAKPIWLGPPDPQFLAIDYARFRSRGPYDRTEARRRYFRACKWLQCIPFRVDRDEELLAYWMMMRGGSWNDAIPGGYDGLLRNGPARAVARFRSARQLDDEWFRELQAMLLEELEPPRLHDLVAAAPLGPSFRLQESIELYDSVLLENVSSTVDPSHARPSGVWLAAALGSPVAASAVPDEVRAVLPEAVARSLCLDRPRGLHEAYLACSSILVDSPEPDAPPFMRTTAWQRKNCQTMLASWAQARHTWVLPAMPGGSLKAAMRVRSPGFIEPVPRFYERFAELVDAYRPCFSWGEPFERDSTETDFEYEPAEPSFDERTPFGENHVNPSADELATRWERLCALSRTFEFLSHKQLRGAAWSPRDRVWFEELGKTLAKVMDQEHLVPDDDAPCTTDIWTNAGRTEYVHVAIGRPQWIYVLYPWKGDDVLCRGAVMPYHEFVSNEPWTDVRWKEELDRADGLARTPTWLAPVSLE